MPPPFLPLLVLMIIVVVEYPLRCETHNGTHADEYAQWHYAKTNTNPDPNRYRRRCPDPNARIQKLHGNNTTIAE